MVSVREGTGLERALRKWRARSWQERKRKGSIFNNKRERMSHLFSLTYFAKKGRLQQVDNALKAVSNGETALGRGSS